MYCCGRVDRPRRGPFAGPAAVFRVGLGSTSLARGPRLALAVPVAVPDTGAAETSSEFHWKRISNRKGPSRFPGKANPRLAGRRHTRLDSTKPRPAACVPRGTESTLPYAECCAAQPTGSALAVYHVCGLLALKLTRCLRIGARCARTFVCVRVLADRRAVHTHTCARVRICGCAGIRCERLLVEQPLGRLPIQCSFHLDHGSPGRLPTPLFRSVIRRNIRRIISFR